MKSLHGNVYYRPTRLVDIIERRHANPFLRASEPSRIAWFAWGYIVATVVCAAIAVAVVR